MTDAVLYAAIDYARQGFPVLPIAMKGKDKRPLIKGWPELATLDDGQIRQWWTKDFPNAGVAVLTGSRSRLISIDVDIKNVDGFKAFRLLRIEHLESVPTTLTQSGGNHFHFRLPAGRIVKGGSNVLGAGVDIRAENNCIVMPPSRLDPKRPPYAWVNGLTLAAAPPLPPEILKLLERKKDRAHTALDAAAGNIRAAPAKGAHDIIVQATWEISVHVIAGKLGRDEVLDAFVPAARERGHDKLEVENALDGAVRKRQEESTRTSAGTAAVRLPDIEPWPEAVEAAAVFRELCRCIRCHVVLGTARLIGVAFWVLHVHFLSIATYCPRLSVSSPRMRCGKTTLLRVIGELTPRPLNGENMSPAVLYHLAERLQPCFLLDEIDNQLAASNPDRKALLGLINSGHERNGKVWRMSGEGAAMVPVAYKTFSPMALAGIGRLSGPTGDRCIHIPLERRLPGERAERFDYENLQPLHDCRAKLARLALDTLDTAKAARPVLPAVLNDRQVDNWRLAFRIAEVAGRGWPAMLRKAAISLSQGSDDEDDQAVQLLADCRAVHDAVVFNFDGWIKSISLLAELRLMEERPWNTYGRSEKPMTAAQLARLLRLFGIRSADHDFAARPNRDVVKGYEWRKFEDAWRRYVPVTPQTQPLPRYHVDFIDI